ncbi:MULTISPECIES: 5'/3'-nucleotidase SurE [Caloramator]|uniref:5'-nucleotidase SurE n=1 Tax=Caloramator proteoclasticus DSM 10124 TaxID=1121262 RepID=A0A1M4TCJ4_9CLOT|nr:MULTISPECIES: 5'/3'-nucleotidase SurE [Caloramator]SHE42078.1 5'-nucleotidase /3'-nucleotidase /exopolyphosphatase [Caloramator proteoclasticus DSM 10124]
MRILLTNDDGIKAEGIIALAKLLHLEHEVTVIAPDTQKSACGHSITIYRPLTVREHKIEGLNCKCFSIDGTPADCVKMGINKLMEGNVDLIISGINDGLNVGTDVLYSGTVSAAIEGAIYKIPSIAVSMDRENGNINYKVAAMFIKKLLENVDVTSIGNDVVLNINVPNLEYSKIKGYKVCNLGTRIYSNIFIEKFSNEIERIFEIQGKPTDDAVENTDVCFINKGFITITPLHYDLTNFKLLKRVENEFKNEFLFK